MYAHACCPNFIMHSFVSCILHVMHVRVRVTGYVCHMPCTRGIMYVMCELTLTPLPAVWAQWQACAHTQQLVRTVDPCCDLLNA